MAYEYRKVSVLCAQRSGTYGQISGVSSQLSQESSQLAGVDSQLTRVRSHVVGIDLWDKRRNAFNFKGGSPVVAHPPCRLWAKLKGMSKMSLEDMGIEKDLGRHCVRMVVENGGVLEHPAGSDLFEDMGLPAGGYANEKGFTLEFPQRLFGHPMVKNSWFFFSGLSYDQIIPVRPPLNHQPVKKIEQLSANQRESTPSALAEWLLVHASMSKIDSQPVNR